jgi:hypothetical protein
MSPRVEQERRVARRRGMVGRTRTLWRCLAVRRLLLVIGRWAPIEGGRAASRPGRLG